MKTQDVDVVGQSKVKSCTIWGDGKVLSDDDEIKEYKDLLKDVVINNMLIGAISDDGTYSIPKELKRDLMRMEKGVADASDRYYIAYAQVLDKTFHFSISIDDLNDADVVATLYLTESVEDYPYLESVRSFVASVILPNDDLKTRIYRTFNLVDTIPDNNDDKLIQNLLLRMLEILNEASPQAAVELPHGTQQSGQAEKKGEKKAQKSDEKSADKPKEKSGAKPAKKAAPKKKEAKKDAKKGGDKKKADKKPDKKKDDKKKDKKLEDLLGKKYDPFKPAESSRAAVDVEIPTSRGTTPPAPKVVENHKVSPSPKPKEKTDDLSKLSEALIVVQQIYDQTQKDEINSVMVETNEVQVVVQEQASEIKVPNDIADGKPAENITIQKDADVDIKEVAITEPTPAIDLEL